MMGKLRTVFGVPNIGLDKGSLGSSLPLGQLALIMPSDVFSSGLLKTTGPDHSAPHLQGRLLPSSMLLLLQLPSWPLGNCPLQPPLCTPPPAGHRQPLGRPVLTHKCLLPVGCLNLSPLQMEAEDTGTSSFTVGYLGIGSQVYSPSYPTPPPEVSSLGRL